MILGHYINYDICFDCKCKKDCKGSIDPKECELRKILDGE